MRTLIYYHAYWWTIMCFSVKKCLGTIILTIKVQRSQNFGLTNQFISMPILTTSHITHITHIILKVKILQNNKRTHY